MIMLTINGEVHDIPKWSRISGIGRNTIRLRIERGWSAADAVFQKPIPQGQKRSSRKPLKELPFTPIALPAPVFRPCTGSVKSYSIRDLEMVKRLDR